MTGEPMRADERRRLLERARVFMAAIDADLAELRDWAERRRALPPDLRQSTATADKIVYDTRAIYPGFLATELVWADDAASPAEAADSVESADREAGWISSLLSGASAAGEAITDFFSGWFPSSPESTPEMTPVEAFQKWLMGNPHVTFGDRKAPTTISNLGEPPLGFDRDREFVIERPTRAFIHELAAIGVAGINLQAVPSLGGAHPDADDMQVRLDDGVARTLGNLGASRSDRGFARNFDAQTERANALNAKAGGAVAAVEHGLWSADQVLRNTSSITILTYRRNRAPNAPVYWVAKDQNGVALSCESVSALLFGWYGFFPKK